MTQSARKGYLFPACDWKTERRRNEVCRLQGMSKEHMSYLARGSLKNYIFFISKMLTFNVLEQSTETMIFYLKISEYKDTYAIFLHCTHNDKSTALNERQRHGNGDSVCFIVKHASNDIGTT